jgi:hypothetical protein
MDAAVCPAQPPGFSARSQIWFLSKNSNESPFVVAERFNVPAIVG